MKVRVLRSFASREHGSLQQGAVVEMPEGADWVKAGHAEPVQQFGTVSEEVDVSDYHTGGGWYAVPGADKKVRKDEAEEILRGGSNG